MPIVSSEQILVHSEWQIPLNHRLFLDKRTRRLGGRNAGVSQSHVHRQKTLLQTDSRRLSDHLSAVEEVLAVFTSPVVSL